jgi:FKBP-type peptidyl-prolyl cis-trans isomerase 2
LGEGSLISGLEKGLIDMEPNETKTVKVPKEEAYGDIQEELFHTVKISELPEDMSLEVGMGLLAKNPDGTENKLRVAAVKEDHIIVDANHPLAGQDLIFELQLVDIQ